MIPSKTTAPVFCCLFILFSFSASISQAEEVSITVTEILAQNQNAAIDPALNKNLFNRLKKTLRYEGFDLIWKHNLKLSLGNPKYLLLSEGHSLRLEAFMERLTIKLRISIFLEKKKVFGPIIIVPSKSPTVIGPRKLIGGDMLLHIGRPE